MESSLGGWRTFTSSRFAESVDREWEEVGKAGARVERRGSEANVSSQRLSSKVQQFALQPVGDGTAYPVNPGATSVKGENL